MLHIIKYRSSNNKIKNAIIHKGNKKHKEVIPMVITKKDLIHLRVKTIKRNHNICLFLFR